MTVCAPNTLHPRENWPNIRTQHARTLGSIHTSDLQAINCCVNNLVNNGQCKILYKILNNVGVYEEPVSRTRKPFSVQLNLKSVKRISGQWGEKSWIWKFLMLSWAKKRHLHLLHVLDQRLCGLKSSVMGCVHGLKSSYNGLRRNKSQVWMDP